MTDGGFGPVVTVSATYGAGGSVIAPKLAEALGLPFIDRVLTTDGVPRPDARSQEGLSEAEQEAAPTGRILGYFARAANVGSVMGPEVVPADVGADDDAIRQLGEAPLRPLLAGQSAVVLGRAGAIVLARRERCFHVRLGGPLERRLAWAAPHEGLTREEARRRAAETDRARHQFVKKLYRTDPASPDHYHLVLDATVLGVDAAVEVLAHAASVFFGRPPAGGEPPA